MTQPLRWDLFGNDQLSQTLGRLATVVERVGRQMDKSSDDARRMGSSFGGAERAVDRLGDQAATSGGQLAGMGTKMALVDRINAGVHSGLERTAGLLAAAGAAARTMGISLAIGGAVAAGGIAAMAVQTAASNESAAISFDMMLGSAQKAQAFFGKLKDFAAATPFDLPTLRSAASGLLTVGVNADRIIPLLTRIGDATAAMGTGAFGVDRAVYALKQMALAGKVTKEDLNQLTDAGIPALEALAAQLHKTVPDVLELISGGKVKPEDMFKALENSAGPAMQRIKGMMVKQSATLEGLWSTFKDNAAQSLAKFAEPAIPGVKKVLDWMGTNLPKGLDFLMNFGRRIGDVFKGSEVPSRLMTSLRETAERILPKVKSAFDDVVDTVRNNREGLEKFGRFVADVLIPAAGELIVFLARVTAGWVMLATVVTAHVVPALRWVTERFLEFVGTTVHGAEMAFGWIPGLGPKLREAAANFDHWAQGIRETLDKLDGKTVDVWVNTHERGVVGEHGGSGRGTGSTAIVATGPSQSFGSAPPTKKRALGGWAPAGEVIAWNEQGGERIILPRPGFTIPAGGRLPGGGETFVGEATITLDGQALWTGLLRFKSRSGKTALRFG